MHDIRDFLFSCECIWLVLFELVNKVSKLFKVQELILVLIKLLHIFLDLLEVLFLQNFIGICDVCQEFSFAAEPPILLPLILHVSSQLFYKHRLFNSSGVAFVQSFSDLLDFVLGHQRQGFY